MVDIGTGSSGVADGQREDTEVSLHGKKAHLHTGLFAPGTGIVHDVTVDGNDVTLISNDGIHTDTFISANNSALADYVRQAIGELPGAIGPASPSRVDVDHLIGDVHYRIRHQQGMQHKQKPSR